MNLYYYLIKYVNDTDARTIGVIAHDGEKCRFRILGVTSRTEVDTTPLSYLLEFPVENSWVYREWVDWFYDVSENECANLTGFEKTMERLYATGTSITVERGISVEVPENMTPDDLIDRLYSEHVAD
jgi:hypothetical protein